MQGQRGKDASDARRTWGDARVQNKRSVREEWDRHARATQEGPGAVRACKIRDRCGKNGAGTRERNKPNIPRNKAK
jgi:hypothetical protein